MNDALPRPGFRIDDFDYTRCLSYLPDLDHVSDTDRFLRLSQCKLSVPVDRDQLAQALDRQADQLEEIAREAKEEDKPESQEAALEFMTVSGIKRRQADFARLMEPVVRLTMEDLDLLGVSPSKLTPVEG